MSTSRSEIKEKVIKYLNEQDDFRMEYEKLSQQFPDAGANFDVCIGSMDGAEVCVKSDIVTLKEQYRSRRRGK